MKTTSEDTATIPRGLPPEAPVELVAVTSRLGRFAVILLGAILGVTMVGFVLVCTRLDEIAAAVHLLKE
jgi:hypothetical protein